MRRIFSIITLSTFLFSTSYAIEEQNTIEFIHGVAVQNEKALYIDFDKMEGVAVIALSKESIKASESENLTNSIIIPIEGNVLYVYDSKRVEPYFELLETERKYIYQIVDNQLLISKDRQNWELATVKLIAMKEGSAFMTIHIGCKFFNGEYDLIGTPNSEPF